MTSPKTETIHQIAVPETAAGERLDVFLSSASELGLSRSQIKNLVEEGRVKSGQTVLTKPGAKVSAGSTITVELPPPRSLDLTPQDLNLSIVFEDEHLAVINKPAGMSVHPSDTEDEPTLVHGLLHALESLSSVGGVARPGIVHRIDKGTSGLLVISKTDAAHQGLSEQFKAHSIDRRYWLLVYGDLAAKKGKSGKIDTFYGRHPVHRKKMTGTLTSGRRAVTHWRVLESYQLPLTLVECKLETGRTHQIRAHMSELGFPLAGDPLYGHHEKLASALKRLRAENVVQALLQLDHQMLHAKTLGFVHPVTEKLLQFESEIPADFANILQLLK